MAQSARIIDISKTFTPIDPQVVESNRVADGKDSYADRSEGITAYEGYNFIPTLVGYKSYFGVNKRLSIPACPAGVEIDKALIFESIDYSNHVIIFANTGIHVNGATVANEDWEHPIITESTPIFDHRIWTTAILDDTLYAYRAGGDKIYAIRKNFTGLNIEILNPTFLVMEGQIGIFKAGGRLGIWDSENSIAWSNFDDHADFKPSVQTLAGSAMFNEVRGKISNILPSGDGFVIYATNSIVFVARDLANTFQWNPSVLMAGAGVASADQVVSASPDTTHYAYTGIGLHEIGDGKIEVIATSITDLLRESLLPVTLRLIENRYLCLQLVDNNMVKDLVEYDAVNTDDQPQTGSFNEIISFTDLSAIQEIE